MTEKVDEVAAMCSALAVPTRARIIQLLQGHRNVLREQLKSVEDRLEAMQAAPGGTNQ